VCDDGVDSNCDGADDAVWWPDLDGDGFGDPAHGFVDCVAQPDGTVDNPRDCDDARPEAFPLAPELCNQLDDDCDGVLLPEEIDADGDGVAPCQGDPDDSDPEVWSFDGRLFTTCGAAGQDGPTQAACDASYRGTSLEGQVSVIDGIQAYVIPYTADFRITATGAQGGSGHWEHVGGRGAEICGLFSLSMGTEVQIAVGQQGPGHFGTNNGSGGGGSFMVGPGDGLLLAAGGGGGADINVDQDGCDGSLVQRGGRGSGNSRTSGCGPSGDLIGEGGSVSRDGFGSAGAGFDGPGATDAFAYGGSGGFDWIAGMRGGDAGTYWGCATSVQGGFGGGGSGNGCSGGGGGGGYTGGQGGRLAGGGGSFSTGLELSAKVTLELGDGSLTIEADDGGGCP
jgi:hypothetical protein